MGVMTIRVRQVSRVHAVVLAYTGAFAVLSLTGLAVGWFAGAASHR